MRPLSTERLELIPLDPARDAESLHVMLGDPEVYRFSHGEPSRNVADTRDRLAKELAGNGGWTWAIRLRPTESALGTVGIFFDQGTPIRGLDWKLRRDHWGRGIMSEAVRATVDQLLAQPGTDGVEAWIDSQNSRSLGVARRAGLSERGRLPRVYGDRTAQSIVMVRAAAPRDPETLAVLPTVPVRDLERAIALLTGILGLHELFRHGDPPAFARLGVGPWSGSPGLQLRTDDGEIAALNIAFDIGIPTDVVLQRAVDAGLDIIDPVDDKPWSRREFTFALPEGHRIRVVGPIRPE